MSNKRASDTSCVGHEEAALPPRLLQLSIEDCSILDFDAGCEAFSRKESFPLFLQQIENFAHCVQNRQFGRMFADLLILFSKIFRDIPTLCNNLVS